jgi:hypothetical protein
MDPILIVFGLAFLVILYEIYSGEILSSIISSKRERKRSIVRKTSPVEYWVNIGVHLLIWAVLVLFQMGILSIG